MTEETIKEYGFTRTYESFMNDYFCPCIVYKFKNRNAYISRWDIDSEKSLKGLGIYCIYYKDGKRYSKFKISEQMLEDVKFMNHELDLLEQHNKNTK